MENCVVFKLEIIRFLTMKSYTEESHILASGITHLDLVMSLLNFVYRYMHKQGGFLRCVIPEAKMREHTVYLGISGVQFSLTICW
jgi:hypothetical protein